MRSWIPLLLVLSCGGATTSDSEAGSGAVESSGTSLPDEGSTEDAPTTEGSDDNVSTGAMSSDGDDTDAPETSTSNATGEGSDTAGDLGPIELYRGSVDGGVVPDWDPDAPRPLVMLGREGDDWIATLARIGADGALSDNVAEEIIVWGFAVDPPILYDGPVGGALEGWDPAAPIPLVMMGHDGADGTWVSTLASIAPDGALSDNFADRIIVWGWAGVEPGAPELRHDGPVGEGALPGWNARDPSPIVALGTPGFDLWVSTLVRIAADGSMSDNVATSIRVWGW